MKGSNMINGPKVYAELSSTAREFLNRECPVVRPKVVLRHEYLGDGANLSLPAETQSVDAVHTFLGQCAVAEEVSKTFGETDKKIGAVVDAIA